MIVSGTSVGTLTGDNGAFVLRNVPARAVTVRAQRIGFAPAEHGVTLAENDSATVNFAIVPIATQLSEIVVVGYGTSTRQGVSSAIASVGAEQIANVPTASVESALQGKAPGVQVMENAGNPGNGLAIRVRGPASINAGNEPLFVVDGVPILDGAFGQFGTGGQDVTAISALNPDEIASIDILKDAAASAIYGSRASNGVVMITTLRREPTHRRTSSESASRPWSTTRWATTTSGMAATRSILPRTWPWRTSPATRASLGRCERTTATSRGRSSPPRLARKTCT